MLVVRGQQPNELAVMPGSPADKAGIQENGILLEVDGKQLNEKNLISDVVEAHKIGDVLVIKMLSKGEEKIVCVKLEKK